MLDSEYELEDDGKMPDQEKKNNWETTDVEYAK
jgi:hypothetical protein